MAKSIRYITIIGYPCDSPITIGNLCCCNDIFCAILYLLKEGCSWRAIPHDFPKWQNVRYHYDTWAAPDETDQGCHYTSTSFIQLVKDKELRQSMSRKGNCWDNAPQERFFGHMKDEIDVR